MTNMEFYRNKIEMIIGEGFNIAVMKDGTLTKCKAGCYCNECIFEQRCSERSLVKWLISEHEDKPTITARERHFLEFIETGWLTRDSDQDIWWAEGRPEKMEVMWSASSSKLINITCLANGAFPLIKWEDEEPWSVEELLKLEVVG